MRAPRAQATQRKYQRVVIEKEREVLKPNEIRIRATGFPFGVSVKIAHLLLDEKHPTVEISGTGPAISKTATILDFLRKRIPNLHSSITIGNVEIIDTYEPLEEGLDTVVIKRSLAVMRVSFTLNADAKYKASAGYQAPLTVSNEDSEGFEDSRKKYESGERRGPKREGSRDQRRRGGEKRRGGARRGGGERRQRSRSARSDESHDRRPNNQRRYNDRRGGEERPRYNDRRRGGDRDGSGERPKYNDRRGGDRRGGEERPRYNDRKNEERRTDDRRGGDDKRAGGRAGTR